MGVGHAPSDLERIPRAVPLGAFDGVHRGHVSVIRAALESSLAATVMTFDPHPREALGNEVELINALERRLELIAELGVTETVVVPVTAELLALGAEDFAGGDLPAVGAEGIAGGSGLRFGAERKGEAGTARPVGDRR